MPRHYLAAATLTCSTMETTLQALKKYFITNSSYLTRIIQLKSHSHLLFQYWHTWHSTELMN